MPIRRAARRLELALDDLDRLIATLRKLKDSIDRLLQRRSKLVAAQTMSREDDDLDECRRQVDRNILKTRRLRRRVRSEWQDKTLAMRLQGLLGRRGLKIFENVILVLIFVLAGLIVGETLLDRGGRLSEADRAWFAWVDLAVCSVLLAEFALKLTFAPAKALYFKRHFLIEFLASLPFGFLSYQLDAMQIERHVSRAAETLRVLRSLRIVQASPLPPRDDAGGPAGADRPVRAAAQRPPGPQERGAAQPQRRSVRAVPRAAARVERPAPARHVPQRAGERRGALLSWLDQGQCDVLAARGLSDLEVRLELLPRQAVDDLNEERVGREIPVEALVERLIQLTPERLVDRMGPGFVISADRYLRLLDAPIVRRLPMIRNLVAYREKSPAEAVTLAANYVGDVIQRALDMIYFLADLQGTLSPAIFLDRVGQAIVNAVRTPAKRLLFLGSAFLVLFLVVNLISFLRPFRRSVDEMQNLLGWPVIVLGGDLPGVLDPGLVVPQDRQPIGRLLRARGRGPVRRPDQELQDAAAATRTAGFLAQRVIDPELLLRSSDDQAPGVRSSDEDGDADATILFENRELHLPEEHPLALSRLSRRLAVPSQRHQGVGPAPGQPRALEPAAQPPRPPAPRGEGAGRLDLNRSGGLLGRPLPLVQLHHPDHHPGDGRAAPGLQPPRRSRSTGSRCSSREERRAYQTGWPSGCGSTRTRFGCPT